MAKGLSSLNLSDLEKLEAEFDQPDDVEEIEEAEDDDDDWEVESSTFQLAIPPELENSRIDSALQSLLKSSGSNSGSVSRSQCGQLLSDGCVRITGQGLVTKKSHIVQEGDELVILGQGGDSIDSFINGILNRNKGGLTEEEMIRPQDIPIEVLYEDEHMIVVNKHAGIVVHPASGNWDNTLVNAVAYHLMNKSVFGSGEFIASNENGDKDENGESIGLRPGIVHRLDKGTTGCIIVAKTRQALGTLSQAFANRNIKKTYITVTVGNPGDDITIDKPIGRHPLYRQKMRVVPDPTKGRQRRVASIFNKSPSQVGRHALSFVKKLAFDGKLSVAEVKIETGRTHQIRVHLQDRGTPVYGDDIYGISDWNKKLSKQRGIMRPLLHAFKLELDHPVTGEKLQLCAPMPEDMATISDTIWPRGRIERPELFPIQE